MYGKNRGSSVLPWAIGLLVLVACVVIGFLAFALLKDPVVTWWDSNVSHSSEIADLKAKVGATTQSGDGKDPANSGNQGNDANGRFGNQAAKTTEAAKADLGIDVQRLASEASAFVWRGVGAGTKTAVCAKGYICTLHLNDDRKVVVVGDGAKYTIWAGTFRWVAGYPDNDDVRETPPCKLLQKEQQFGVSDTPSFDVVALGFSCSANSGNTQKTTDKQPNSNVGNCPVVGPDADKRQTKPIEGGGACKLEWNGKTVSITVPTGWTAETDAPGAANLKAGQTATVGSATFRKTS